MQTFLTYTSLIHTAAVLDDRRLNKQLVEARQLYDILTDAPTCRATKAQRNHPIVATWRDYPHSNWQQVLPAYITALHNEYRKRTNHSHKSAAGVPMLYCHQHYFPVAFCITHREALRAKFPQHYAKEDKLGTSLFSAPVINYLWYHTNLGWYTGSLSKHNVNIIANANDGQLLQRWETDCINRGLVII